jgi:hypothetical protein
MCYRGAQILAEMLPVYLEAGWDIFLHVDLKADQMAFRRTLGSQAASCHFVDPVEVFWGGYSMVEAELKLIRAARGTTKYDRFVFVSDDTMPLFPASWLNAVLGRNQDLIGAMPQGAGSLNHFAYYNYWHYDHPLTTERLPAPRPMEVDDTLLAAMMDIAALKKIGKKQVRLAHGYAYWVLSEPALARIDQAVAEDAHLVRSFRYARQPDELMLQTLFFSSKGKASDLCPVYMDFHSQEGGPRVIDSVAGLPFDLHQHQPFVRKIHPEAHSFARAVAWRLLKGWTAWGHTPDASGFRRSVFDEDGREHPVTLLRLAAPPGKAGAEWNGVEMYTDRKFRWTAAANIAWVVTPEPLPRGRLQCFIPLLMQADGMSEGARLVLGGQSKPLVRTRQSLIAEFDHDGLAAGSVIRLTTPPPVPASAGDNRKIGLAIAVEPL